jgi:hypothetical protein
VRSIKYVGEEDSVILEENSLEDMKNKCVINGIHMIGINTFEYSFLKEEVNFSGSILTEDIEAPKDFLRDNLEYLLDY